MSAHDESPLYTRLGVRRPNIVAFRVRPLAGLLHIRRDDSRLVVLAKLLWQVDHAIECVAPDSIAREALRYGFNLPRDARLNRLMQGERLSVLEKRKHGATGWKRNTLNKKVHAYGEMIYAHWWAGDNPQPPDDAIEQIVLAEERYEQRGLDDAEFEMPPTFFRDVLRDVNSARMAALESMLPYQSLFFEVSDAGRVVTIKTPKHEQLPVFTTEAQFAAFAGRDRKCEMTKGSVLLELLAEHPDVGLSMNPIVGDPEAFHWTAQEMPRLQQRLRSEGV